MFFPLTLPREGRGSPRVSRKKKRPRPLHFFESFKTLTLTQFVNALTVFPHYSPVLLEMGPDLKMKEKQQRLRLVCVCARVRAYTLQGVLQAAAVCSNRKCAVSLNLLPRWSWFTEIRPVTLLLNQSDICWMFFLLLFFSPPQTHMVPQRCS